MKYFPIFLRLENKPCLVVGGGEIAHRKVELVELLKRAGAAVTVVAPELSKQMSALVAANEITHIPEVFSENLVTGNTLVIAATNDKEVNASVARCC